MDVHVIINTYLFLLFVLFYNQPALILQMRIVVIIVFFKPNFAPAHARNTPRCPPPELCDWTMFTASRRNPPLHPCLNLVIGQCLLPHPPRKGWGWKRVAVQSLA